MAEMVERYCRATGRDGLPDLDWHFAFFRLAAIRQGIKKRALTGTASSAQAETSISRLQAAADAAWRFARRAGA